MKRFDIRHRLTYRYSIPVFLEPQTVRLRPRDDAHQRCVSFDLSITPTPAGSTELVDLDGNRTTLVWFEGLVPELTIESHAVAETARDNPFGYLIHPVNAARVPVGYEAPYNRLLGPYRRTEPDRVAAAFARDIASRRGTNSVGLLLALCDEIRTRVAIEHRDDGPAMTPAQTLERGRGACRDLTLLFMEAARAMGMAARFVSGYARTDEETGRELHAWAEIYLPGAGWQGFDPTWGLAASWPHIAVAASAVPEAAAPVSGSYLSSDAVSKLDYRVQVVSADPDA